MRTLNDVEEQIMNEENTKQQYIAPVLQRVWCNDGDRIVMEYGKGGSRHFFIDGIYDYPHALVEARRYNSSLHSSF